MLQNLDRFLRRVFLRNLHMKLVALLLTLALYLWVSVDREVERTRYVPLRINVPTRMVLVNDPPDKAGVTIRGKWSDLRRLDASQLDVLRVQIDSAMGTQGLLSLTPDMVELPPGLRAVDIQPEFVEFQLEERGSKVVPIRAKIVGEVPTGYRVHQVSVTPDKVRVTGPETALNGLSHASTEPININYQTQSFSRQAHLRLDDPLLEYQLSDPPRVSVEIVTRQVERTIRGIKVAAINADLTSIESIEPTEVSIVLRGPKTIVEPLKPSQILASVDLSGQKPGAERSVEREVQIRNIPPGVELISKQPRFFRVHLAPVQVGLTTK